MNYFIKIVFLIFITIPFSSVTTSAFFSDDMVNSLTESLEEATKELSEEMNNLSIDVPASDNDVSSANTQADNDSNLFAVPNMNASQQSQAPEQPDEIAVPQEEVQVAEEVEVVNEVEVIAQDEGIFTPMGRDIERVIQYDLQGYPIIMDMALFMNSDTSMFTEDIDGNLSFDAETVTVAFYLPQAFKDDEVEYRNTAQFYESIYDTELNIY